MIHMLSRQAWFEMLFYSKFSVALRKLADLSKFKMRKLRAIFHYLSFSDKKKCALLVQSREMLSCG